MKRYLLNVLIALDQLANTILGGSPDATISARTHKNAQKYWYAKVLEKVIDGIFRLFGQRDHCLQAYLSEVKRAHLDDDYK